MVPRDQVKKIMTTEEDTGFSIVNMFWNLLTLIMGFLMWGCMVEYKSTFGNVDGVINAPTDAMKTANHMVRHARDYEFVPIRKRLSIIDVQLPRIELKLLDHRSKAQRGLIRYDYGNADGNKHHASVRNSLLSEARVFWANLSFAPPGGEASI